jgi:hypothetical protein
MLHPRVKYLKIKKRVPKSESSNSVDPMMVSTETKKQLCQEMIQSMYQELEYFLEVQRVKKGDVEYSLDLCALPRYEYVRFINLNNKLVKTLLDAVSTLEDYKKKGYIPEESGELEHYKRVVDKSYDVLADADVVLEKKFK